MRQLLRLQLLISRRRVTEPPAAGGMRWRVTHLFKFPLRLSSRSDSSTDLVLALLPSGGAEPGSEPEGRRLGPARKSLRA